MPEPITKPPIPFVGREAELYQLHQALQTTINSKTTKFVLIQADYGVGKTALVEHFLTEISSQNSPILIGLGKCAIEKETSGLVPFTQLFTSLTNQGVKRFAVMGDVFKFAKEVAPAWLDIITAGAASATVKTVNEGRKLLGSNTFSQENVFVQFTNALSRLAEKQPVIAFIEDLHWADASSLSLLFHVARNLQNLAVLFIITYRPVEAMESGVNAPLFRDIRANLIRYGAIELEIRQGIDLAQYVAQRYSCNAFSSDLINRVQKLTDGHALFVNQVFSLWEDKKLIFNTSTSDGLSQWQADGEADILCVIPQTLGEVLAERIRSMSDELREILVCASVEGEDFTVQTIARLRQLNEDRTIDNLELLDHHYYLIQEDKTKQIGANIFDFYRFAHRFFREHIYSQLPASKKRILHRQVAECLEALYTDRSEIAGQLARHFREALDLMKSTQYALMAAQFEQSRYAWEEGERWCEFGLDLVNKLPANIETKQLQLYLLEQSGNGYFFWGKHTNAYERYRTALTFAKQLAVPVERVAGICNKLSLVCDWRGLHSDAMGFVQEGLQIWGKQGTVPNETFFSLESGRIWLETRKGNNHLAVELSRQILKEIEALPSTPQLDEIIAFNYDTLSSALGYLNQYADALVAADKAIDIAKKTSNEKTQAMYVLDAAWRYFCAGDLDKSMALTTKGKEIALKIGDLDDVMYAKSSIAEVLLARGKFQEAVIELTEAIAVSEQIGALFDIAYMHANLAIAYLSLSNKDAAYQHAGLGAKYAEEILVPFQKGYALDALARVEAANRDWNSAAQHFNQAIAHHEQGGDRHYAALSKRHFAEMLIVQENCLEAVKLLKEAMQVFQELGLSLEITKTQALLNAVGYRTV